MKQVAGLERLVRDVFSDDVAVVLVASAPSPGSDVDIEVKPRRSGPAPVWLSASDDAVFVRVGGDMRFEVSVANVGELTSILESVRDGRVRERVWRRGDAVVGSRGQIDLGGRIAASRTNVIFGRRGGEDVVYEPYARR